MQTLSMQTLTVLSLFLLVSCANGKSDATDTGPQALPTDDTADDDTADDDTAADDTGAPSSPVTITSFSADIDPDCSVCGTATIELDGAAPLTLLVGTSGEPPVPWVKMDAASSHQVPVLQLHADTTYELIVRINDGTDNAIESEPVSLTTGPLPDDLPFLEMTQDTELETQPGLTVFAVARWSPIAEDDWSYLIAVDGQGQVVWYRFIEGLSIGLHVDNQSRIYSTETALTALRIDPFGQSSTEWTMADLGYDSAHHEVQGLSDDGMAIMSSELRTVEGWVDETTGIELDFDVVGDLFVTFDSSGETTWQWSILDHIDPIEHHTADLHGTFWMRPPYEDVEAPKDWSHGNAMVANGDGWLGSFRNLDWLVQVDPITDEIEWILGPEGDFELTTGGRWFSRQHAPEIQANGNILLYDNGNARADAEFGEQPWSRVVEYALDHETNTVTEVWSWDGGERYFCPIVGDANRLENNNMIITDGAIANGSNVVDGISIAHFSGRVREITTGDSPEVAWELTIGHPGQTELNGYTVYRAIRFPSLYPPNARP
jgi:hypothetical protein